MIEAIALFLLIYSITITIMFIRATRKKCQ